MLCSMCGRREAVYLRASSGERLCSKCLERSLVKRVKRTLSRSRSIGPRDRILIPVTGLWPSKSAALLRLVSIVEKPYPSQLMVLVDEDSRGRLGDVEGMLAKQASFHVLGGPPLRSLVEGGPLLKCLRLTRAVLAEAARRLGAGIVMMPLARDFFTTLLVSSMLRGDVGGAAEHRSVVDAGGVRIAYPLYDVECSDLAMYQYLLGVSQWASSNAGCMDELDEEVFLMVSDIASRGRELLFSAQRVLRLFKRVDLAKCPYCGGLCTNPPSSMCREAGVGRIIRSLEVYSLT